MKDIKPLYTALIQIAVVIATVLIFPLMIYVVSRNFDESLKALASIMPSMALIFAIFMLNYWWLVPRFYFRKKKISFFLVNIFVIILYISFLLYIISIASKTVGFPVENLFIVVLPSFITVMFVIGSASLALALRNSSRNKVLRAQMLEEQRRHTEDELIWLKNQINPHFLFNTLNNISALVEIDAAKAQDCISRLSDLLRYAMYETSRQRVPLYKEVEFMKDYISLMQLRCNCKTIVTSNFEVESGTIEIAPLLLISLIENAFKHGVSSNLPSEISVSLKEKDSKLLFECVNTNHAKGDADNSGSGIGLPNMRRRLELLYPDKFEWNQSLDENLFKIKVVIEL
ncbi:MAG: histidine kinase [Muribaculaceae bacterium]|nr:histidine kinase [Muribaculaceae bacterium]